MNKQSFKQVIILITITVTLILGTQIYRTVSNYQVNKQRFINDIQLSLDLAIEKYYADKAREDIFVMSMSNTDTLSVSAFSKYAFHSHEKQLDSVLRFTNKIRTEQVNSHSFAYAWSNSGNDADSSISYSSERINAKLDSLISPRNIQHLKVFSGQHDDSSSSHKVGFKSLTQKIMISISEDLIELGRLNELVREELDRKSIFLAFQLEHTGPAGTTTIGKKNDAWELSTTSKTTYLPQEETLTMYFENASMIILQRGIFDLIVSLAIVLAVLGALLYLYRIISEQKQLAMIKDDLISNITHEFKTPISTISTAIEALSSFNEANDTEKIKRYLGLSQDQLKKLNLMVEKLLETATIDSGMIQINVEETDLNALTKRAFENYSMLASNKRLSLNVPDSPIWHSVDPFHIENVLSNLIDNAIKYGGDQIDVGLQMTNGKPTWTVKDNGGNIDKVHKDRIFEKLYRIPKGNQHDVKGFGIGLYYTKAVVEKHGGSINLQTARELTKFTVKL